MIAFVNKTYQFLRYDIWKVNNEKLPPVKRVFYGIIKKLILAVESFTTRRMLSAASALTYSTLLAIVPILAVVFAIARGFGYNKYIENWFRDLLSSQPQAADILIGFVNSYLVHTKSGIFLGIGLLFMLWTVIMLISNIERAFNDIWQVNKPRNLFRTITDYMAMFLLAPIVIVVTSGISIAMAAFAHDTCQHFIMGPMMRLLLAVSPYVIMSCLFIALYMFMPNTKVKFKYAIVPGILAGVAMQGLQLFYIHSQIWVTSYNAIYGSFAALPLFMLCLQISWTICLFGAELCYTSQNLEDYAFMAHTSDISHQCRQQLAIHIMSLICKRYEEGGQPYSALQLKLETNIPIRVTHDLLNEICNTGLLIEVVNDEKGDEPVYIPLKSPASLSVGELIDKIESQGSWTAGVDIQSMEGGQWQKVKSLRNTYLGDLREVLLKDLSF